MLVVAACDKRSAQPLCERAVCVNVFIHLAIQWRTHEFQGKVSTKGGESETDLALIYDINVSLPWHTREDEVSG